MTHFKAVSVLYLLEPVGWLIPEGWCPLSAGASRMAHSRGVNVLYLLELVGWLILEELVSFICWSQQDGSF